MPTADSSLFKELKNLLKDICQTIKQYEDSFKSSEEQVKISLVLPILSSLGWDIKNPSEVMFEVRTETGGRTDILLTIDNKNVFLIEVKNLSQHLENYVDQLGKYLYNQGIPYGALTNGKEWIFFEAFSPGKPLSQRVITKIDICENTIKSLLVLPCLNKKQISFFKECIKKVSLKFKDYLISILKNGYRIGSCNNPNEIEKYICELISYFLRTYLEDLLKKVVNNHGSLLDEVSTHESSLNSRQVNSSSTLPYEVVIGGIIIKASSRPKLLRKILEEAFKNNWISLNDLPLSINRTVFLSLKKPPLKTGIRELNINGNKIFVNLGNSGQAHSVRIKGFIEHIVSRNNLSYKIRRL